MAADTLYGNDNLPGLDERLQPLLPQLGRLKETPPQIITLTSMVTPQELKEMCMSFASVVGRLEQAHALHDHLVDEILQMIASLDQCRKVMETLYRQILDLRHLTPEPLAQMKTLCEQAFPLHQYRRYLDFIAYLEGELVELSSTASSPRATAIINHLKSVSIDFWVAVDQYNLNAFGYVIHKITEKTAKHPTVAELPQFRAAR